MLYLSITLEDEKTYREEKTSDVKEEQKDD